MIFAPDRGAAKLLPLINMSSKRPAASIGSGRDRMRLWIRARRICEQVELQELQASKSTMLNQEPYIKI